MFAALGVAREAAVGRGGALGFDLFVAELDGAGIASRFAGASVESGGWQLVLLVTATWFGGTNALGGRCCIVALVRLVASYAGERGEQCKQSERCGNTICRLNHAPDASP